MTWPAHRLDDRASHAGVYRSFLGLAAVYTWPLATNLGASCPPNGDPRLFSWVLLTIFGNLTSRPELLFHGNAFYPFGNTLSFAEPLLVPALVAGPLHAWTAAPSSRTTSRCSCSGRSRAGRCTGWRGA